MEGYAKLASTWIEMKRTVQELEWEKPRQRNLDREDTKDFEELKKRLVIPPILVLRIAGRPFMIGTDARMYAIDLVLLQQKYMEDPENCKAVGYFYKPLQSAESNY